jgi:hypothetical protein
MCVESSVSNLHGRENFGELLGWELTARMKTYLKGIASGYGLD